MLFVVLLLFPLTAVAGEKISGTNFFVVDGQEWETGDGSGYWMWHGTGVSRTLEGPGDTNAIECHGAGFWDEEGSWGEGICVETIGEDGAGFWDEEGSWGEGICVETIGEDTVTSDWKEEKGQDVGQWNFLSGTGKYAGVTGGGTYKSQSLPGGRSISEWEGEVTFAE
jgi:hypothetical protein